MDVSKSKDFVGKIWDESIVPTITEYIKIPNKSPMFDPKWRENGHMDRAVDLISGWCKQQPIAGMTLEVVRLENRTPVILMDIPGDAESNGDTVLLYGHLDKQPEMTGWNEGLGPWTPVMRGDKLYGRGGADDGYAAFASLTAIRAAKESGAKLARCVVLIEACEESGSFDLPAYIEHLAPRIGSPSLVICLDSGCGSYDQMWCTTSLRGLVGGDLTVQILGEGVHSGDASGIVPSSFRILRQILSRLEDEKTGRIKMKELWTKIPAQRMAQARGVAKVLGNTVWNKFPFAGKSKPMGKDNVDRVLNRTWRPTLSITGVAGIPPLDSAGNVLRPQTAVKVSVRIPPLVDGQKVAKKLKALFEKSPPYGAKVEFKGEKGSSGWNAPLLAKWLEDSMASASMNYFGKKAVYMGEGGTIPFMGMLGEKFPKAQFMITGVLGPGSNAHGPNEFLHIPTGKKLTCCVAQVLEDHAKR